MVADTPYAIAVSPRPPLPLGTLLAKADGGVMTPPFWRSFPCPESGHSHSPGMKRPHPGSRLALAELGANGAACRGP